MSVAYVSLTRLNERRSELGREDVHFQIRGWPIELVNGAGVDGAFIGEKDEEIKLQVATDLFASFDANSFAASSPQRLALTAAADEVDEATGEGVPMELRPFMVKDGVDIDDPELLAAVAQQYGVADPGSVDVVLAEYVDSRARHVAGSPRFFLNELSMFCLSLDVKRVDGALRVNVNTDAFATLVSACLD